MQVCTFITIFASLPAIIHCNIVNTFTYAGVLTITDLRKIQRAAWDSRDEWYNIGLELSIDPETLNVIKRDNAKTNDCFREMLTTWLKIVQPKPTLAALAEALQSPTVGFERLAEQVQALK